MFERFEKLVGKEILDKLATKTVLIIGVGGVGGYVTEALARSGIGHLVLIDHDQIDITNKNRQIIALDSTIGKLKVEAFRERIHDINPACRVDIHPVFLNDQTMNLFDQYQLDYVVDACDTVSTKKEIIIKCLEKKISFLSSMGTGNKFDPSQLEIIDIRKTNYDPLAKIMRKFIRDEHINQKIMVLSSREHPVSTGSRVVGSTSFVPGSAGLLIASYIIQEFMKSN